MSLREILFGRPIADADADEERIAAAEGVPVLGLDALASAAYGPEAALTVLLPLGVAGTAALLPILAAVVALLLVVQFSYRQTIAAYPDGGGSFTVVRQNLGRRPALVAAAALALDYVLNVAVAISAGVGALASALPRLLPLTLPLCLALVLLLVVVNLRGVRSAGLAFAVPTYAFIACLGGALAVGTWRALAAGGHPAPVVPPPALPAGAPAAGLAGAWLLLRGFASGCTAMTGVEAVSDGVPVFREPRVRRAQRTLSIIVAVLCALLVGVGLLARAYGLGATPPGEAGYQSVLSQLVAAIAGRGAFYLVTIAAVVCVLCLSANTSFADFPRLCRLLALDEYLPEAFAHAGPRLVYSTGIVVLGGLATILLVVFRGITDRLIPLFAVGAFLAFTLSQAGMVAHWRRAGAGDPSARRSLWINGAGAVLTAAALLVIAVAKFAEGAWVSIAVVPAVVVVFARTRAHYERVRRAVATSEPLDLADARPPVVVVPVRHLDKVTRKALQFALSISPEVHAVQVLAGDPPCDDLRPRWGPLVEAPARAAGLAPPRLVVLRSEFRDVLHPIARYARTLARGDARRFVGVVVPELVERRWYHYLLHSHTATVLKAALLFRGGPRVVIINAPWVLRDRAERRARRRAGAPRGLPAPEAAR